MLTLRPSGARGHVNHGWLNSFHSFSFGSYHDPAHMGFSDLRVINQDIIQPSAGFPTHSHKDMEIVTYVMSGTLAHRDSMGNVETIGAGEWQRMTAGTGVQHSEYNASDTEPVELLQIWILPEQTGLAPGYEQILLENKPGWQVVASRSGSDGTLTVHQDVTLWHGSFAAGEKSALPNAANRNAWVQVVRGELTVGDLKLSAGDGARITGADKLPLAATRDAELLLFDLR